MGLFDLYHLQDGFASLVKQANPEHLPSFFLWLDLKVAQFKINGSFIPDKELAIQKIWIHHAARRLFDQKDEKPVKQYANGSGISASNLSELHNAETNGAINLRPCGDQTKDASSRLVVYNVGSQFDARCGHDASVVSNSVVSDSDLNRVMLRVPILSSPEPRAALEPLDFSRSEKKSRPEGKETVKSLLREALCKSRNVVPAEVDRVLPPTDLPTTVAETQNVRSEKETKSEEISAKLSEEQEKNSCPYCSKTFQYRSSYRRHVKIHQGIFSHMCYVCGRKFTRKEHYVRHKCNRRPNKPNRGQDLSQDVNSGAFQSEDQMALDGIEDRMSADLNETKLSIKTENQDVDTKEVSFLDDGTDEEFGRIHESRRKSSTPRKLVIANDSNLSDVSDVDSSFIKRDVNDSFFSERSFNEARNTPPQVSQFLITKQENCDEKPSNDDRSANGWSPAEPVSMVVSNGLTGSPEKTGLSGAASGFLNLQTGSYKVEEIDDDETSDSGKTRVITIKKQAKYLKLKNEAHIVDGNLCFSCPHCFKTFHRSSNFSRHMRIHRGVYSYICQTCGRGFFRREHFQKHKCHRKSMSTVCDRRTKFDLLHNSAELSGDTSPPAENPGEFVNWHAASSPCNGAN